MSFKPFTFKLTPPITVPDPTRVDAAELAAGAQPQSQSSGAASKAGQLVAQISGLQDTSQYLQNAINQRFASTGIELDLAANPEVSQALSRIYGTDTPPNVVTIPMLNNMLDAEAAITQMEIVLGNESDKQPNPVQVADLNLVTTTVEKMLNENGEFQYQLPTLLRTLKADQIAFQNWNEALQQYPILRANQSAQIPATLGTALISARSIDIHDNTAQIISDWADRYAANYSSIYQFMAGVSSVDQTINSVVSLYVVQPVEDILRVVSLLKGLKGLFHKNALKQSVDILTTFVFARMASDLGSMMFTLDRYVHMAVDPLKGVTGGLGDLIATINRATATVGIVGHGGVPGLPAGNQCAQRPHAINTPNAKGKTLKIPGLDKVSQGLQSLGQHLNWATNLADKQNRKVQESLRKLLERKNKGLADKLDILCSLQSLDTLITLAEGVVRETQKGHPTAKAPFSQQIESLSSMLASVQSGTGTPFVIQNGQVVASPVYLPTPPPTVQKTLRTGGLDLLIPDDLTKIKDAPNA